MSFGPERLRLTVHGQPAGAGSKTAEPLGKPGREARDRSGRIVLKYRHASKFTAPWMEAVAKEAEVAWAGLEPLCGPLWFDLTCYEERPAGHFRGGRARLLRAEAPAYPDITRTHDSGKMRRAAEDALTGIVWGDDKQVVDGHDRKLYCDEGDGPRAVIRVGVMEWATVEEAGIVSTPPGQAALV